jgi:DNA-binding transcriptional regulator of glucitol operon
MRRVLTPKWWLLHLVVFAIAFGMLRLGLWQWHRAHSGHGGIQTYAYAFQWPIFVVFGLVLWVRTLQEELRRDPTGVIDHRPPQQRVDAEILRQPGLVIGVSAPDGPAEDDDPEVAAWNARLAALNTASNAVEARRTGTIESRGR